MKMSIFLKSPKLVIHVRSSDMLDIVGLAGTILTWDNKLTSAENLENYDIDSRSSPYNNWFKTLSKKDDSKCKHGGIFFAILIFLF